MIIVTIVTDVAVASAAAAASTAGADLYDISEPVVVDGDGVGGGGGGDGPTLSKVLLLRLKYGVSELQQTTDNIGVELYDEGWSRRSSWSCSSSKTLDFDLVYEISDAMSSENVVVDLYSKGCAIEGTLVSDIQQSPEGGAFDPSDRSSSSSNVLITHSTVSDAVQTGLGYVTQQVE